jgi:hypothetical protein
VSWSSVILQSAVSACRRASGDDRERGDVPGWVLVTVMTAGLVAALWLFAEPLLTDVMQDAVDTVTGNL